MSREVVLVVDDDPGVCHLMRRTLEGAGYQVISASEAVEALAACNHRDAPIQLAILDIRLPGMDGIELAGRISLLMPATKRLFVTGLGGSDALGLFGFEQNDPVLAKPFSPFALLAAVDDVLHKHAL